MGVRVPLPIPATPVAPGQLCTRLGREILYTAEADTNALITVTGTFRTKAADLIEVTLHPEVPSHPVHPILRAEPIVFVLPDEPHQSPEVYATREDFPAVPHLIRPNQSWPGQLCLFERPYEEYRARLSGQALVSRTLLWLKKSALGTLHGEDQPLEALMHRRAAILILPAGMAAGEFQPLELVSRRDNENAPLEIIVPGTSGTAVALLQVTTGTMTHGVIRREPRTLGDLGDLLVQEAETNLAATLSQQLSTYYSDVAQHGQRLAILHLRLPKARTVGASPSSFEHLAFLLRNTTLSQLGELLDLWVDEGTGALGKVLSPQPDLGQLQSVALDAVTVMFDTNRLRRAAQSGFSTDDRRFVALGAGALGSQVITNLVREGQGTWVIADDDVVLPHNLVRHVLFGHPIGWNKAKVLSLTLNNTFSDAQTEGVAGDALEPSPELQAHLGGAEVILDFTASPPVTRHLALSPEPGRRASAFLNPTGQDLVLLVESADRETRLDHLEHTYLQSLVDQDELASHYGAVPPHLRYGGGCRDISAQLSQELLALHAATASRALRRALAQPTPFAALWRAHDDGGLTVHPLPTRSYDEVTEGQWTLHVDPTVIVAARRHRDESLRRTPPVETGGALIGSLDLDLRVIYVTGLLPPPADSRHYPAAFERGVADLRANIETIEARTAGALTYLGEWHTHPRGVPAHPSGDDQRLLDWLCRMMSPSGAPGVMLIIGEHDERWLVESAHVEVPGGSE